MLLHYLALDALALVLQGMDPQDLQRLDLTDGGALFRERGPALTKEVRFVYVAARVLTAAEQTWFAERGLSVRLLQEHKVHEYGTQEVVPEYVTEWYQHGRHNRDGAVIGSGGTQEWYQNGQMHRDHNLPAINGSGGTQAATVSRVLFGTLFTPKK